MMVEWIEIQYCTHDGFTHPTSNIRRRGRVDGYLSDPHGQFYAMVLSEGHIIPVRVALLTEVEEELAK